MQKNFQYQSLILSINLDLKIGYSIKIFSMYKRSEPNTRDAYDYQNRTKKSNKQSEYQTEASVIDNNESDGSLDRFINDEKFIKLLRGNGVKSLFKIQIATFRVIYEGQDIIARDRTGSGKTLAFTLPILQRMRQKSKFSHTFPKYLIILPTRQLAIQVFNELQKLRFKDQDDFQPCVVYGKSSIDDNIRKLKKGVDILVATPGRLNDLVERGEVKFQELQVLCLDEADQILKQGFKQQIQKVFSEIGKVNKNKIQTLLFSATIPQWLKQLSSQYQSKQTPYINMINDQQIRTSKQITHKAIQISRLNQNQVVSLIEKVVTQYGNVEQRILIFCQKKAEVNDLSKNLKIKNQPLHGDIAQGRRQKTYHSFKNGHLRCIVATNVAARGLDFPSVDLVIQMKPPLNTEEYIHRAGRTGRAGKQGTCLTFYDRTRNRLISKIEGEARIKIQQVRVDTFKLQSGQRDDRYGNDNNRERNTYGERRNQRPYDNGESNRDPRNREQYQRRNNFERNDSNQRNQGQRNSYQRNQGQRNQRNKSSNYGQRRDNNYNNRDNFKSQNNYQSRSKSPQKKQFKKDQALNKRNNSRSNSRSSRSDSRSPSRQREQRNSFSNKNDNAYKNGSNQQRNFNEQRSYGQSRNQRDYKTQNRVQSRQSNQAKKPSSNNNYDY